MSTSVTSLHEWDNSRGAVAVSGHSTDPESDRVRRAHLGHRSAGIGSKPLRLISPAGIGAGGAASISELLKHPQQSSQRSRPRPRRAPHHLRHPKSRTRAHVTDLIVASRSEEPAAFPPPSLLALFFVASDHFAVDTTLKKQKENAMQNRAPVKYQRLAHQRRFRRFSGPPQYLGPSGRPQRPRPDLPPRFDASGGESE
jgi:hypothetical protein